MFSSSTHTDSTLRKTQAGRRYITWRRWAAPGSSGEDDPHAHMNDERFRAPLLGSYTQDHTQEWFWVHLRESKLSGCLILMSLLHFFCKMGELTTQIALLPSLMIIWWLSRTKCVPSASHSVRVHISCSFSSLHILIKRHSVSSTFLIHQVV